MAPGGEEASRRRGGYSLKGGTSNPKNACLELRHRLKEGKSQMTKKRGNDIYALQAQSLVGGGVSRAQPTISIKKKV